MINAKDISAPVLTLSSGRLKVEIATPGGSVQRGTRFDVTGHVAQVTLDGKHTFCVVENFNDSRDTGGLGLCNEFVGSGHPAEGALKAGDTFPKLGVGIVEFTGRGEGAAMERIVRQPCPVFVEGAGADGTAAGDTLVFLAEPVECDGIAMRLRKTLTVHADTLTIAYEMENAGEAPITSREYNHNFVQIDGHEVGPDYELTFSHPVEVYPTELISDLIIEGGTVRWARVPKQAFFCLPRGFGGEKGHTWQIVHEPSGVGLREIDDFAVEHIALWGKSHVVSPEVFIEVALKPGETARWARKYEFFAK